MSTLWELFSKYFLHLDKALGQVIETYHIWTLLLIFVVIFCETGLVVTPFLPGDSLLFAAGTFAGMGRLPIFWLWLVLACAAILGDSSNYWIGRFIGPKVFSREKTRFFKKKHLDEAHAFYVKHGGKAVFIGRFLPLFRTFIPFVAGIGKMHYPRFLMFSVGGTVTWVSTFIFAGYFFGGREFVQKNFTVVIMGIILISLIPTAIGYIQHRREMKRNPNAAGVAPAEETE